MPDMSNQLATIDDTSRDTKPLPPKIVVAVKAYVDGRAGTLEEAAKLAGKRPEEFRRILFSAKGQELVTSIDAELDITYKGLYQQFIRVVRDALNHPDPAVALSGANLFAKTKIGAKVNVNISAEDIVQRLMAQP